MQTDGNFVLYDAQNRPLWASGTNGQAGAYLAIQDDGNLVVYKGTATPWSSNTYGFTQHKASGGFDIGQALNDVANVVSTVAPGILPGSDLLAAIVTGKDPIAALKQDINNFSSDAALATAVSSGNWGAAASNLTARAQQLGINLPPVAVQAAIAVAQNGGDPTAIATAAMGPGAWNAATNFGTILTDIPPPPGLSYKPNAQPPAASAPHPVAQTVQFHLAAKGSPAANPANQATVASNLSSLPAVTATASATAHIGAYPPYPARHA